MTESGDANDSTASSSLVIEWIAELAMNRARSGEMSGPAAARDGGAPQASPADARSAGRPRGQQRGLAEHGRELVGTATVNV